MRSMPQLGFLVRLIGITERDGFACLNDCGQLPGQVWAWEAAMAGSVSQMTGTKSTGAFWAGLVGRAASSG
jgi:hypothetical protein